MGPLQDAVKVMAKSLVRNRHAVTKMFGLKSQLQAVSLRIAVRSCPPSLYEAHLTQRPPVLHSVQVACVV